MNHTNLIPVTAAGQRAAHFPNSDRPLFSRRRRASLGALLMLTPALIASAQNYTLDWYSIDGGGGFSTGGLYSVNGTIGQPDAGPPMAGGNYSLTGGFWSLVTAVPPPGAPRLTIMRTTPNTVVIAWPSPSTGWNLQQNTDLNTTAWTTPPESIADDGTTKSLLINPPQGNRFYRLFKP